MKHEHNEWNVYCYTNLITGQQYVGCTCKPLSYRSGKNGASYTREDNPFGNAIRQYGWENFSSEVIEVVSTQKEAYERERFYIEHLHSIIPDGYNRASGGAGSPGVIHDNPYWSTHEYPEEVKKRISETLKGRVWSDETRKRRGQSFSMKNTGRVWCNDGTRNYFVHDIPENCVMGMLKKKKISV